MNLDDVVDSNFTTRKMRSALQRKDLPKEVERLSKKKNSNSDPRYVQPQDGANQRADDGSEATAVDMQDE